MKKHTFTFMGTGSGCGVPSFFCDCPACEEARREPRARRGCCGTMIRGNKTLLIDAPPDTRHQLLRENITSFDELLLTHCHFDHIGGLGEYEYMVQLKNAGQPIPVFGSEDCLVGVNQEFNYLSYCLDAHILQPFDTHEFDGVRYTALPVTHAPGTYGYLIETEETRMFYASDTAVLPAETAERIHGVDILAMDATFWKNNWNPNSHHSIQQTIEEGFAMEAGKIYLTHMCMHYDEPITLVELEEYLSQYNGRVLPAADGLTFEI